MNLKASPEVFGEHHGRSATPQGSKGPTINYEVSTQLHATIPNMEPEPTNTSCLGALDLRGQSNLPRRAGGRASPEILLLRSLYSKAVKRVQ